MNKTEPMNLETKVEVVEVGAAIRYAVEEETEKMGTMATGSVSVEEASLDEGQEECDSNVQGRGGPLRRDEDPGYLSQSVHLMHHRRIRRFQS
jgi:hypothetical protein